MTESEINRNGIKRFDLQRARHSRAGRSIAGGRQVQPIHVARGVAMQTGLAEDPLEKIRREVSFIEATGRDQEETTGEQDCGSFGWYRGIRDRAETLDLRFRNGNRRAFPVATISDYTYDPSRGIGLKIVQGDGTIVRVTITGLNLNGRRDGSTARLYEGLLRCRVPWVRESDDSEELEEDEGATVVTEIVVEEA
ncbi:hypothetical protein [Tautonia rosea]|uniref:hypothetical protein n=1 Tax=Tautonia rosea TaxID=2728037 RepID=UPI0014739F48|nr:hypothetical protein [Tautonia rosea]